MMSDMKSLSKKSEETGSNTTVIKGILKYRTQKEKDTLSEFGSDYQIPADEILNEIEKPIEIMNFGKHKAYNK